MSPAGMRPRRPAAVLLALAAAGCVPRPLPPPAPYAGPVAAQQAKLLATAGDEAARPAPAAWWHEISAPENEVFVGSTADAAIWVDKHYRVSPGGTRIAFAHWEFPSPQSGLGYLSERYVEEIDCDAGRSRVLETYSYAERLAAGRVVHTELAPYDWTYMHPGSAIEGVARLVCPPTPAPHKHHAPARKPPAEPATGGEYL